MKLRQAKKLFCSMRLHEATTPRQRKARAICLRRLPLFRLTTSTNFSTQEMKAYCRRITRAMNTPEMRAEIRKLSEDLMKPNLYERIRDEVAVYGVGAVHIGLDAAHGKDWTALLKTNRNENAVALACTNIDLGGRSYKTSHEHASIPAPCRRPSEGSDDLTGNKTEEDQRS